MSNSIKMKNQAAISQRAGIQASKKPTKKQLDQADDYHKMKEYFLDRYMSQLRSKMEELDQQESSSQPSRSSSAKTLTTVKTRSSTGRTEKTPKNKRAGKISVPKSKRLTMIEAEEKLAKAGLIKTDEERAEFRNGISTAEDINSYTEAFAANRTASLNRAENSKPPSVKLRPLSRITESQEFSASGRSRPATQSKKQMNTNLNPLSGNKKYAPADIARAAAAALEKRCPRMEVPELHCLRSESRASDGETELVLDEMRGQRRDKYANHVLYLREMYQRAQANTAQARRIIDDRDDDILQLDRKQSILGDLAKVCADVKPPKARSSKKAIGDKRVNFNNSELNRYDPEFDIPDIGGAIGEDVSREGRVDEWRQQEQQQRQQQQLISTATRQTGNLFTPIEEEPDSPHSITNQSQYAIQSSDQLQPSAPFLSQSQAMVLSSDQSRAGMHSPSQNQGLVSVATTHDETFAPLRGVNLAITDGNDNADPLTFTDVETELKIIESKSMSSNWSNYLKVGKSVFARDNNDELALPLTQ